MDPAQGPLLDRLFDGVRLHERAIAEIASRGEISIVLLEPSDAWREALHAQGWKGEIVLAMSERMRRAMSCADSVTERWLTSPRSGIARIFAVIDDESLLVNSDSGRLSVEPGSTDEGAAS